MYELKEGYNVQMRPLRVLLDEACEIGLQAWQQRVKSSKVFVICRDDDDVERVRYAMGDLISMGYYGNIEIVCLDGDLDEISLWDDPYNELSADGVLKLAEMSNLSVSQIWVFDSVNRD